MTPSEIRALLMEVAHERLHAECLARIADRPPAANPDEDIAARRAALVGTAVTELAILYGQLYGRNLG